MMKLIAVIHIHIQTFGYSHIFKTGTLSVFVGGVRPPASTQEILGPPPPQRADSSKINCDKRK